MHKGTELLSVFEENSRIRGRFAAHFAESFPIIDTSIHELIKLNINPSSNAETIEICR